MATVVPAGPPPQPKRRDASIDPCNNHAQKRRRIDKSPEYGHLWSAWPAPPDDMESARSFIFDIVDNQRSVLLVPDKDADGLSAGTLLYKTLRSLGHPPNLIKVHHLKKGTNVCSDSERLAMAEYGVDRAIVLDQGSRPGPSLLPSNSTKRVLIIDHHMSSEFPLETQVLTACNTPPIATAALLTYVLLRDMHPDVRKRESWRAIVGAWGDLGPKEPSWGTAPWPGELAEVVKRCGSKALTDAVAAVNAPRRTADYDVPKAWTVRGAEALLIEIYLDAESPAQVASNAFFKLCRIDVNEETERWARTAPKFSADGRVAVITIHSAFQIHPVIATRWAGNLGRKSKKLIMIMCANTGYNPDPKKISFSCRIASGLRSLPESERPNLIALLQTYGDAIEGFRERVGGDFAQGHKEATGGIIPKDDFGLLMDAMDIKTSGAKRKSTPVSPTNTIQRYFSVSPVKVKEDK